MCGIVGFVGCGSRESLQKATDVIVHRGPDAEGVVWFDKARTGFGHRRLSIIDLSEEANQPMWDETRRWLIVYNGEVYNFAEIREDLAAKGQTFYTQSDTEVILQGYLVWGESVVERLNGMFAFAIYDTHSGEVFAARDRLGIKPLYYYHASDQLVVASEIKSILACPEVKASPDYRALHTPLHFQTGPETGFENISKVPPGYKLRFSNKQLSLTPYWEIQPEETSTLSVEAACEELEALLLSATEYQMIADVPIGVLLSGGLDSSLIAAMMAQRSNTPLHSFTIKFGEKDLKQQGIANDSFYARKLAEQCGFDHLELEIDPSIIDLLPRIIRHLEEPLADPAAINTLLISEAARERDIKVLLSGMGADEVFGGYRAYKAGILAGSIHRWVPGFALAGMQGLANLLPSATENRDLKHIRWMKRFIELSREDVCHRHIISKDASLSPGRYQNYFASSDYPRNQSRYVLLEEENFASMHGLEFLTKACYSDSTIYMPDHNLNYSDKSMMAASVEGRPPLIDHRLVEFMFRMPPDKRIHGGVQKFLLKKVAEKYLPHEIIYRPKAPFAAPLRGWIKGDLHEMIMDVLSEQAMKDRGLFDPAYVSRLIAENTAGKADHSQLIFRTLVTELWFREFFDRQAA